MPDPVIVSHALGSYPVYVESGILRRLDALASEHLPERRLAMIADASVYERYREGQMGPVTWTGEILTVPPGESSKSRETWAHLTDELLGRQFGRDSGVIAFGGGVVGDLAGFVAATYMRGLPHVLVPTTLVAMLDASVGGKTGINAPQGKNLIGAFHPPVAVVADPRVLRTLPDREYRSGLAEAVKHGLIADADYFEWMEAQAGQIIKRNAVTVTRLVRRSVEIKAEVVSEDERESGRRAVLNAGHTIAHAIERYLEYRLPHGEAVALGLVAESEIAERLNFASPGLRQRVAGLLARLGLPLHCPYPLNSAGVMDHMQRDKKNRSGLIHCALPAAVGRMHVASNGWTMPVPPELIQVALQAVS